MSDIPRRRADMIQHAFAFERAVVSPYTFVIISVPPCLSLYVMAVLVQLPHTSVYRIALLPVVFWLSLRAAVSLDFSWNHPGYTPFNYLLVGHMFTIAMRSATWAFAQRPYSRSLICKSGNGANDDHAKDTLRGPEISVSSAMWNGWDLVMDYRLVGWDGPVKIPLRAPYFPVNSPSIFALLSFRRFIFLVLVCDFSAAFFRAVGSQSFGTPQGGTIFDSSLPPPQRYLMSSIVTLVVGITTYVSIDALYQLQAAFSTLIFGQHPSKWPPPFDFPWMATSLHSFWGRRWHQFYREVFVALGSKPVEKYLGRVGNVIGAFALSAVLHAVAVWGMSRNMSDTLPVVGFFLMQGIGVAMEYTWQRSTGRHVGGLIGWLWTILWLLSWGNLLADVWAKLGLLGAEFGPIAAYRPSTLLLNWISYKA